jgi:hypothetical protein
MPGQLGAHRGFLDDSIAALLVLNDARRRAVARVFGLEELSRNESFMITLLALSALAGGSQKSKPQPQQPKPKPKPKRKSPDQTLRNVVIGGAVIKELGHRAGGRGSRDVPGFVALVAFAMIWRYHPLARGAVRAARESIRVAEASERRIRSVYGDSAASPRP